MKLGIEVEGRLRGIKTLFMNYDEIQQALDHHKGDSNKFGIWLHTYVIQQGASHLYISDHANQITPHFFNENLGPFLERKTRIMVTLEVTQYNESWYAVRYQYPSLGFMLSLEGPPSLWSMSPLDQVKFTKDTRRGPAVLCTLRLSFQRTDPDEFQNDVELPPPFHTQESA